MEAEATWKVLKHRCSDLNQLILSECQLQQRLQNALKASAHTPRRPDTKDAAVCFHPKYQNQTTQTHPPARIASQSVQIQTDPPIQAVKKPPVVTNRSFISFLDPTLVVDTPRVRCHARSSSIDFLGSLTGFQPGLSQSVPFHRRGSLTRDSFRSIEGGPGHVSLPPTRVRRGSLALAPAHTFPMWKRPVHPPKDSGTPTRQESRARIKAQSRAWRKETQALKRKAEPDLISPEGVVKKVKSQEEVRPRLQLPVASPSRRTEQTLEKPMKGLKPKRMTPKRSTITTEESNDSQSEWESSGLRPRKPADNPSRITAKLTSDSQSDDDRSRTRPKLSQPPTKEHAKSKKPKARPPPKSTDLFSPSSNTDFESESMSSPEKSSSKFKSQEFVVSTSSSDHSDSEPEEALNKETPKSNVGVARPEKRPFNEKELIPLGANRCGDKSKSINKPLDISMLKKRLEATKEAESAVKKTPAKIDPKPSRQFGRLPASLLKTKSIYEGTPITSDEGSRHQDNVDLEEGARYESMAPRRRISLAHRKVDSSSLDSGSSSLSQDEKPDKIRKIVTKPSEQKLEQGKEYSKENSFQEKILERIDRDGPLKLALLSDFGPPLEQIPSPDYRPQSPESPEPSSKNVEDLEPSMKELKQEHRSMWNTQSSKGSRF
ncbi:nucleolar protein dao-5-like [Tigriopus californicus]|uniref:nucleolar protein dao-5-like n=1 Tax=Tigriopus californicus TaxID=6832 RepID=UPI0027DA8AAC|nr:nucleolar protein dao-5-like [Tigriopus californicus]